MFRYRISEGRWFTAAEERGRARVTVLEEGVARLAEAKVGDRVAVDTSAGPVGMRVIGLASNQQESALAFFVPLATMRAIVGSAQAAGVDYWVRTDSHAEAFVDRVTTRLEDTLTAHGYEVATEIEHVREADDIATNRSITTTLALLGFFVVAISAVALVNAITMSVLERRREIGVLRCVGARARDVRRIFAAEGVTLALAGWLLGIPVGYLLHRLLVWLVAEVVNVDVPVTFPLRNVLLALAGTLALALASLLPALARAVRLRPGVALRYV
jgi:putative ABC transport system permease protein